MELTYNPAAVREALKRERERETVAVSATPEGWTDDTEPDDNAAVDLFGDFALSSQPLRTGFPAPPSDE
jgi:hypothetical protein